MTDSLFDLSGRVGVVTGGMGQLGSAYAAALAARGMRVAVLDTAIEPGPAAADLSGLVKDGTVRALEVDVTDRARVEGALAALVAEWGVPHLLVNNAAIDDPPDASGDEVGSFEDFPESAFDRVMDVNVKGTLVCCQVVGGAMAREGRGSCT
jgi:NAD(P)-dependent dehydrogenase (short-subunit alcohol dehydrogenase family)